VPTSLSDILANDHYFLRVVFFLVAFFLVVFFLATFFLVVFFLAGMVTSFHS